ncbi:MAG: alpha/beta hydrolase family protein, partial [Flavobacteriaceae bacterium]
QDLIKNPSDAYNFKQLTRANILKISLKGETSSFLDTRMYRAIRISPDGKYVMISFLKEPFSYLVTYSRFPLETHVYDMNANLIKLVDDSPLEEVRPKGFMATKKGKRSLAWRADKASTLYFTQALDEGDPQNEVAYRDALYQWKAPFNEAPEMTVMVKNRISNVIWGNDRTAVISDRWWNTRNTKTYVFDPSKSEQIPQLIFDRNYQDVYSDPGRFVTKKSKYNTYVLSLEGNSAFLIGSGFSDKGQFPFVDRLNLSNANASRVYESSYTDKYEGILDYESDKNRLYVRIESPKEFPNYYYRNLDEQSELDQLTSFENPFKALAEVEKELVSYQRKDGLELSGVLYTPAGYDKTNPDPLPMILWAYPREYKDKSSAAQKTNNPNRFIYPSWGSPIYWVTQGYVVLDRAAFPIIGEGDTEPNDSFRPQLVANAEAAIDAVVGLGYADRDRVAVGGHSYGAFMVANLLSHSNLFAAGIARSGAYNRTLTPFGFQSEPRSYWEAPEVYYTMSPFMHADKMKTPLLLVHGEEDNNSGTYPMQSERYYNALKGLGATTRLVMFPKESHGYRAKETILHLIWEQDRWLEKHVKSKKTDLSKEKTPKG